MAMKIKPRILWLVILVTTSWLGACVEKDLDPSDPAKSFATARETYDDGHYEIALQKLGEFKARFPYSKFAVTAELLMANAHYELGHYEEAAAAYSQFVKLHPNHEKVDFAMYRVGDSYWVDAPEEVDREQEFTMKALEEWERLIERHPDSQYAKQAKDSIAKGRRRIAESMEFVAKFYCKMEIYHACAYRFIDLANRYPDYKDLQKEAYEKAANSLDKLAKEKREDPESDKNLYFKSMTAEQIEGLANELRQKLAALK